MGKLFVLGGFTFVYLIFTVPLSVILFIFGMCHRPIKTYKETRRKKYRMMAEQTLAGQPAFDIKPLNNEQKQTIQKKSDAAVCLLHCPDPADYFDSFIFCQKKKYENASWKWGVLFWK